MLYKVKTTSGYAFALRGVSTAKLTVATAELRVKLYNGNNINLSGVTEFDIVEDDSPWMNSVEMIPPTGGDAAAPSSDGFEFKREEPVPAELAACKRYMKPIVVDDETATTTFCHLERLIDDRKSAFSNAVVQAVKDAQRRGVLHA